METTLLFLAAVLGAWAGWRRVNYIVRRRVGRRQVKAEVSRIEAKIRRAA